VQARDFALQVVDALDRIDSFELGPQRLEALSLDRRLIHAARVVIADFLIDRPRRGLALGGVLEDRMQHVAVVFHQYVGDAPARVRGWYRVLSQPSAVRVPVEVGAGGDGRVEVRPVE